MERRILHQVFKGQNTRISMQFKDFVKVYENNKNKQIKFDIQKKKLKEFDLKIKDLLDLNIPNKKGKIKWQQ